MPDREKVINGLECCTKWDSCSACPYQTPNEYDISECTEFLHKDALALLKEQKKDGSFIVIDAQTGKEADTYNIALHEDWAKHLCYCDMDGWAIQDDGSLLLLDECGRYAYADRERFKVVWDA